MILFTSVHGSDRTTITTIYDASRSAGAAGDAAAYPIPGLLALFAGLFARPGAGGVSAAEPRDRQSHHARGHRGAAALDPRDILEAFGWRAAPHAAQRAHAGFVRAARLSRGEGAV